MTRQELGVLLLVGYGAVGVILLYAVGDVILRWSRNRARAGEPR